MPEITLKDQDLKAEYKYTHSCHIVKIKTWDTTGKHGPSWRPITELFVASEELARNLVTNINSVFDRYGENLKNASNER